MPYKPEQVLAELKNNKFAPLYFLQGDEPYYVDVIAEYIETHALSEQEKGFNLTVVYGRDTPMKDVMSLAKRFPIMAQRQVVIVKEAQEIPDLGKDTGKAQLAKYAEKPVPSTILVFAHKHKKINLNQTLGKTLEKYAVVVESKALYENQVPAWIQGYCKEKKIGIDSQAAHALMEAVGVELTRLANEVDKLLLNFAGGKTSHITSEHISRYVGQSRNFNTFEFQRALGEKNTLKAYKIANYFAANPKEHPLISIIASLFGYFSKILLVHHYNGVSSHDLAKHLQISPFFVKEYLTAARYYPLSKVIQIIHDLRQADLQSKGLGATVPEGEILKELVFKILY
jgi:DNA polymerase-3 subunit delta